jgi:hypothetical protein
VTTCEKGFKKVKKPENEVDAVEEACEVGGEDGPQRQQPQQRQRRLHLALVLFSLVLSQTFNCLRKMFLTPGGILKLLLAASWNASNVCYKLENST